MRLLCSLDGNPQFLMSACSVNNLWTWIIGVEDFNSSYAVPPAAAAAELNVLLPSAATCRMVGTQICSSQDCQPLILHFERQTSTLCQTILSTSKYQNMSQLHDWTHTSQRRSTAVILWHNLRTHATRQFFGTLFNIHLTYSTCSRRVWCETDGGVP